MLAALGAVADGSAREFRFGARGGFSMFVVRRGETLAAFVNACPHFGTPLNDRAPTFLTPDGSRIRCTTHFSEYRIDDGFGLVGFGKDCWLDPVPVHLMDGAIVIGDALASLDRHR
jgi:nitrite reductase/ring-hydroxylating ferredoxin subunit